MKKYPYLLFLLLFLLGCSRQPEKQILVKINDYEITKGEFDTEFKQSAFGRNDTPESRREFLSSLIDRKLILQDAQQQGLDKNASFLKMIERFWEQSLLKLTLDEKSQLIANSAVVNELEIKDAYQKLIKEGKTDKSYEQMYKQIKWELARQKGSQMMNNWIASLRKKARIKINSYLLNP